MILEYFKGIYTDRYILMSLVNRDLQNKYRKSHLGILWAMLTPLAMVLIIGSVYSIIFGVNPKTFIPSLFAGLTPWLLINSTADSAIGSFINAEGYLKQTAVNSQIFPLRVALVNLINFMYSVLAYFSIYLFLQPDNFGLKMLLIVPNILLLFIFILSWANIVSIIALYLRDFQPFQAIILQALFYVTPIIFPHDILKDKGFELIYLLNPLYYFIELIKIPMIGEKTPSFLLYIVAITIATVSFLISIILQMKVKKNIALKL